MPTKPVAPSPPPSAPPSPPERHTQARNNGLWPVSPNDIPSEPRRPVTPAERVAGIIQSLHDNLRLVNEGVAHVTDRYHICVCSYPPDWVDLDGILADQLDGVRRASTT